MNDEEMPAVSRRVHPTGVCTACGTESPLYGAPGMCLADHKRRLKRDGYKANPRKRKCVSCNQRANTSLGGEPLCRRHYMQRRHGEGLCVHCNEVKLIHYADETGSYCRRGNNDRIAPASLKKYVASFATPYPNNDSLFRLLVEGTGTSPSHDQVVAIRKFGEFLKKQELPELKTWDVIEGLLPRLEKAGRFKPKMIRRCLLNAGHLLAEKGELETWEEYVAWRQALAPVGRAPDGRQEDLRSYAEWLRDPKRQQFTARAVRIHLEVLSEFWSWAAARRVTGFGEVTTEIVQEHLDEIGRTWLCPGCKEVSFHDRAADFPKKGPVCAGCGTALRARCSPDAVRHKRSTLKKFFQWAFRTRKIGSNPVLAVPSPPAPKPSLTTYPESVVMKLEAYIRKPDTPALHAVILTLILHYAFGVEQLRTATVSAEEADHAKTLGEIYAVEFSELPVSRGRHHRGLHGRFEFHADDRDFLAPKLDEYGVERDRLLKAPRNRHLFVTSKSGGRDAKVSGRWVANVVAAACEAALGEHCSVEILEKTSGLLIAGTSGAGPLAKLGWSGRQAFHTYTDHPELERRTVSPGRRSKKVQGLPGRPTLATPNQ